MANEVSSGVTITPDKTVITYLLKEDDWQKDAAKQCKEDSADYLPLVAQRVRRVGEKHTHKGIEKFRSGEDVTIEVRMQPIDQNPLPPPARVIIYCGGGFQGWRKLGPSPLFLYNFMTGEKRPFDWADTSAEIDWLNETFESFEWCPIGSDSTTLYVANKSDDSIWRYDKSNGWRLFCEKPKWPTVEPEPWWHNQANTPEWRSGDSKWWSRDKLCCWKEGTLFCFQQLGGNSYRPMSYSEQEGWQQLGPDWSGGSGTYTNSASWSGIIAYPGYPVVLDGAIIYEIREYSGSSDNPVWVGTAMYSQGPDMPFRSDWRENQMTPKCNSDMHESMADQGTFVKDDYKKLYFIAHVGEQYSTTWNKNTSGCDSWEQIGYIGFNDISRLVTVENKILCAEKRNSWSNPDKVEYWVFEYSLDGGYGYPQYAPMDEYTFNQDPKYRPDISLEIAVGFNSLVARDQKDGSIWMFRPTEQIAW